MVAQKEKIIFEVGERFLKRRIENSEAWNTQMVKEEVKIAIDKAYEAGKSEALKRVKEIMRKIAVMPNKNSATQFYPYIYYEDLLKELAELNKGANEQTSGDKK